MLPDSTPAADARRALGRWLGGIEGPECLGAGSPQALLAHLQTEGVVGLAASKSSQLPADLRGPLRQAARDAALTSMLLEAETRRVLSTLRGLGEPALLLKGSALAFWAYPQPQQRQCSDVDVLLPSRASAERLSHALAGQGYSRADTSGELVAYELMCSRQVTADWKVEIDVHWRLVNSALFGSRFTFEELMEASVAIPFLGPDARGLGPVHALLHAALHRASNLATGMGDGLKWLYDFVVLADRFTEADWRHTVQLAAERQIAGPSLSALRSAQHLFGIALPPWALTALEDAARREPLDAARLEDWRYMELQTARSLPGLPAKLTWLWQRLFPSHDYLIYLYGKQGSYVGLLWERLQRASRKWRR